MSAATAITATRATRAMPVNGRIWPRSRGRVPARTGAAGAAKLRRWAVIPSSFRGHVPLERVWRVLGLATHGTVQGPCRHEGPEPTRGAARRCGAETSGRCKDVGRAAMRFDAAYGLRAVRGEPAQPVVGAAGRIGQTGADPTDPPSSPGGLVRWVSTAQPFDGACRLTSSALIP